MGWILFKDIKTHLLIFFFFFLKALAWGWGEDDIRMITGIC